MLLGVSGGDKRVNGEASTRAESAQLLRRKTTSERIIVVQLVHEALCVVSGGPSQSLLKVVPQPHLGEPAPKRIHVQLCLRRLNCDRFRPRQQSLAISDAGCQCC